MSINMNKFNTLPDDCLYKIFSQLPIADQVSCAKACLRFRRVISYMIWRAKYKKFKTTAEFHKALPNTDYQKIFSSIAIYLEELTIIETRNHAFSTYLERYIYRPELAYYFKFNYKNLNSFICVDANLHDGYITILAKICPQLTKLHVSSEYISGKTMTRFDNLKVLYLPHCSIPQHTFNKLCSKFNLTHLDIRGSELDVSILYEKPNTSLIELWIPYRISFTTKFIEKFENFQKLKFLKLDDLIYDEPTENFINSVAHKIKEVQYFFRFEENQRKFQGELVPKMIKLKKLHMWFNGFFTTPFNNDSLEELHLVHLYKKQSDHYWVSNFKNLQHIYLKEPVDVISTTKHWLIPLISQIQDGASCKSLILHLFENEPNYEEEMFGSLYMEFLNHMRTVMTVKNDLQESLEIAEHPFVFLEFE